MTVQDKQAILKLNEGRESSAAQSVFDYSIFRIDDLAIQAMDAFGFFFKPALGERDPQTKLNMILRMFTWWNTAQYWWGKYANATNTSQFARPTHFQYGYLFDELGLKPYTR